MREPDLRPLQQRLVDATDFGDVMHHFFDEYAEKPGFLELGATFRSTELEAALAQIARRLVGPGALDMMLMKRLPGQRFVHGAFMFGQYTATVLFFEDIERGLLAMGGDAGPTEFARFSLVRTAEGKRAVSLH